MNDTHLVRRSTPSTAFRTRLATRRTSLLVAGAWATMALFGCATEQQVYQPLDTTKYTLENTDRFAALDRATQQTLSCTGIQQYALADGRLEIIANLKNRDSHRVEVQASCAFRDEQGLAIVEETPWKNVSIAENATEAVRFTANNAAGKKFTIRVRQPR